MRRRRRRPPRGSCRRRRRRRRRQSGLQLLGLSLPLALSLSLWLRERRRESRRGCGRAEGICSSQNSPLSSSAAAAAAVGFFSSSSPPPLSPSPYSPLVLSPAGLTLWSRGERERRTASETANGHSSAAARFTPSFKLEGTFTERHSTARPKGSQAERAAGRPATAVRGRIIPMLRVSVAVVRSVVVVIDMTCTRPPAPRRGAGREGGRRGGLGSVR